MHSKLHLIDLAGSERLKKTMESPDGDLGEEITRKESMAINQSLTFLEQCVVALSRKNPGHVPFRQSKLTNILKDCLGQCTCAQQHHKPAQTAHFVICVYCSIYRCEL